MRCRVVSIHAPVPTTATTRTRNSARIDVTMIRPQRRFRRGVAGGPLAGGLRGGGGGRRSPCGGGGGSGGGGRRGGGGIGGWGRCIGSRRIPCDGSRPGRRGT